MVIEIVNKEIFQTNDIDVIDLLKDSFSNEILDKLYFIPKKVDKDIIKEKLNDRKYVDKVLNTINSFRNKNIEEMILDKFRYFEENTNSKIEDGKLFIIIGLDTTTIYSVNYNGEDVTVLLLESTDGKEDMLDLLLAHEFTHFIRKQKLKKNIFEDSIGERFVTEGIGCNYSREMVPGKYDYEYCIVNKEKVEWVKNNKNKIEKYMINKKDTSELMGDYFSMSADSDLMGMPTRTGYIYGYFKVWEYLEKNNLKVKDIIDIDWREII